MEFEVITESSAATFEGAVNYYLAHISLNHQTALQFSTNPTADSSGYQSVQFSATILTQAERVNCKVIKVKLFTNTNKSILVSNVGTFINSLGSTAEITTQFSTSSDSPDLSHRLTTRYSVLVVYCK